MFSPVKIIVIFDQVNDAITMNNSPIRLIEGGRAKLVRVARTHHVAIRGRIDCKPRASVIVRL